MANDIWDNTPIVGFGEDALREANRRIAGKLKYMTEQIVSRASKIPSRFKAHVHKENS